MINEVKFIMLVKKSEEFADHFNNFYELVGEWVEKKHSDNEDAYITGISNISPDRIEYSWERRGCSRGCCGSVSGDDDVLFEDLLTFIQEENKNG